MDISDRKRLILAAIVTMHQNSGDPVGSKSLLHFLDQLSVSSATLRNEMSELTALGYLEQPHTSAGRVPTPMGVRFYIDNLMDRSPLKDSEKRYIDRAVAGLDKDPTKAAKESAVLLSQMFGLASIASTPTGGNVQVIHYELLRVGRYNIAVLAVTGAGSVLSRVARVTAELTETHLSQIETVLNTNLAFVYPEDLTASLMRYVTTEFGDLGAAGRPILTAAAELLKETATVETFSVGEQNLLHFRELDGSMKELLEFFSDSVKIRQFLENDRSNVTVYIGGEDGDGYLDSVSIVAARYKAPGDRMGGLGIVGPTRLNYSYILPRLSYFCRRLESVLE